MSWAGGCGEGFKGKGRKDKDTLHIFNSQVYFSGLLASFLRNTLNPLTLWACRVYLSTMMGKLGTRP